MKRSITLTTLPLLTFIFCTCATMLLLAACVNHIAEEEEEVISGERHKVRIPTTAEANLLRNTYGTTAGLSLINSEMAKASGTALTTTGNESDGNTVRYLCNDARSSFALNGTTNSTSGAGDTRTYYLRLVRTIHITSNKQ